MADIIDVQNALVSLAAQTIYPNGIGQASSVGVPVKVYAGWPTANTLDADLAAGISHVTIYTLNTERNTTRFSKDWQQLTAPVQTLTLTITGQTVTVGGTVTTPQNVAIVVFHIPYVYAVQAGDTLATIATGLAALIPGASSTGAVITMPATANINAVRVGASGTSIREIRRQERVFQIVIWSNTPANRDAVSKAVDTALAATEFLTFADQSMGRLIYRGSPMNDMSQIANLYRRDLNYSVEYATTQTEVDTQITQEQFNVSNSPDGVSTVSATTVTYI